MHFITNLRYNNFQNQQMKFRKKNWNSAFSNPKMNFHLKADTFDK